MRAPLPELADLRLPRLSLRWRLLLALLALPLLGLAVHAGLVRWPLPQLLAWTHQYWGWSWAAPAPWSGLAALLTLLLLLPVAVPLASWLLAPLNRMARALEGLVLSYRDGDFSMSIAPQAGGELGTLLQRHAELGQALRAQRQQLAQRELLLDTVVQNTPLALVLTDAQQRVTYANLAARQLLAAGRSLTGADFAALIAQAPETLRQALQSGEDQLFSISQGGSEESYHLSQRDLTLYGQPHRLLLLRRMTRELSRQEVASWKKVIRVISHELNNSLAPISSLAHSGAELARRGQLERLPQVFATIGERAAHLHGFLAGYASFAKLPNPRLAPVDWGPFIERLQAQYPFRLEGELPAQPGVFDAAQIEQALINLLKNAHEAGGDPAEISLGVSVDAAELQFAVSDGGPGMNDAVLAQALLPFYSTKRSGTGLGLALVREIAEAHGGRVVLVRRAPGGMRVGVVLPRR